jgi:succinyl-CoA synthetase beta subunit
MDIHEYQAKQLLAKFEVPVPNGKVILDLSDVENIVAQLNPGKLVVKAQIHAGGRGKAGGVKVVSNATDACAQVRAMFGMNLVTHQTGPEGQTVRRVYVEEAANIVKEYYLGIVVDRASSQIAIMVSTEGGVDIEEVAISHPEKIIKILINPLLGLQAYHARKLAFSLGLTGDLISKFSKFLFLLYKAFIETDANQVEINPLVLDGNDNIVALDAKFNFDDNALYRQKLVEGLRDIDEEEPLERRATSFGLSYVKMDGVIGCMVNGAGLAMSTMDIIKLYGLEPANFLDVGGGADKEKVCEAFKIILSDHNVKGILVNIFGGIMRCDIIAEGIIAAAREVGISIPLVVRLAGTNFELGKKILDNSGLKIISADDLADAAEKIVKAVA